MSQPTISKSGLHTWLFGGLMLVFVFTKESLS